MEHFYKNIESENWFDFQDIYTEMVKRFGDNSIFVEVGSWKGMSACFMVVEIINSGKNIRFDCVDTWQFFDWFIDINKVEYYNLYEIFLKNIEPVKNYINIVKDLSWNAATLYEDESIDFVFIDAGHDYESIRKDITAWLPKVKKNGVMAGHDYSHKPIFDVTEEILGKNKIKTKGNSWVYEKIIYNDSFFGKL